MDHVYLSAEQIAERWGCSSRFVRKLIHKCELPGVRFGHILRVLKADLDRYEQAARATAYAPRATKGPRSTLAVVATAKVVTPPPPAAPLRVRMPSLPPAEPAANGWGSDARKGAALIRKHREVAAAFVQWPVIYPRWMTSEQKHCVAMVSWLYPISPRRYGISRGKGGRAPDDPELRAAIERLYCVIDADAPNPGRLEPQNDG